MRVAITGTENSHAEAVIDYLNVAQQQPGSRVVALSGGDSFRNQQLAELGRITTIVDDPTDLLGAIDAVIVCERNGAQHRAVAEPFLDEGLPVYVDKPFTCSLDDAQHLIATASRGRALLTSYSPLRYAPEVSELAKIAEGLDAIYLDAIYLVEASGPADPASEYGGIHFYGSHHADIALRLTPGSIDSIEVERADSGWTATARVGHKRLTLHFEQPRPGHPFRVALRGAQVEETRRLTLDRRFFWPGLQVFFDSARSGIAPLTAQELIRPVQLLSGIAQQLTHSMPADESALECG